MPLYATCWVFTSFPFLLTATYSQPGLLPVQWQPLHFLETNWPDPGVNRGPSISRSSSSTSSNFFFFFLGSRGLRSRDNSSGWRISGRRESAEFHLISCKPAKPRLKNIICQKNKSQTKQYPSESLQTQQTGHANVAEAGHWRRKTEMMAKTLSSCTHEGWKIANPLSQAPNKSNFNCNRKLRQSRDVCLVSVLNSSSHTR